MINVYHGSYVEVKNPDLNLSRDNLDFGKGFYVTSSREQAIRWARRWLRRGQKAIVNSYVFYDELLAKPELKVKIFPAYDLEWLHYVIDNRNRNDKSDYDIVCGGVANDKVFNTLELFFEGLIHEDEALNRLKFEKPNNQICIRRQELIPTLLRFISSVEVSNGGE